MVEPEEKLLKDYFQDIKMDIEVLPEVKLDAAIRNGMQHGRNKKIILRRGYTVAIVALLAAVLFVILPWAYQASKPERAQLPPKSWGELEVYRQVIGDNVTINSALDAGFVQQVNVTSPEVGGLQMTVNGVIVDRRGVILMYTIENHTDQKMMDLGFMLKKNESSLNRLSESFSVYSDYDRMDGSPGVSREVTFLPWNSYQETLPDQIFVTLTLVPETWLTSSTSNGSTMKMFELNTVIDLDEKADYARGRNVELNENLSFAGQKIIIDEVYIGPTGIYMRQRYGGENTMKIFSPLGTKLVMGEGDQQKELEAAGALMKGGLTTSIYHNDNMRPEAPITLGIEGINALDKSKLELIVNTETKQILKAPDEYLEISKRMADAEPGLMLLDHFIPKEGGQMKVYNGFSLDGNFTDAAGSGHWLEQVSDNYSSYREYKEDATGISTTSVFNIGKEKLPQPLTFKLSDYANVIMEPDALRIR